VWSTCQELWLTMAPRFRWLLPLLLAMGLLWAGPVHATAGLAEYSWLFPHRLGSWIEWHHGDICPPEASGKNCLFVRRSAPPGERPSFENPKPFAPEPSRLYLPTILALLPFAGAWQGLGSLLRSWRQGGSRPAGGSRAAAAALAFVAGVSLAWIPWALGVLFPASPARDGWEVVIALAFNIPIVLAPFGLWWSYRGLFPPSAGARAEGARRSILWAVLLVSGVLAPLLPGGPPNLLLFLFPPALGIHLTVSLLVVTLASGVLERLRRFRWRRGGG
jgi:hypothetical protein